MKVSRSLLLLVLAVTWMSCSSQTDQSTQISERLDVPAFAEKINTMDNALILDVRTPGEYQGGRIPNSQLVNFMQDDFKSNVEKLDRDQPVLVYCAAGGRSNNARQLLKDLGFKEVYELKTGFTGWSAAGKEIEQ